MRLLHTSDWHLGRTFHGVDVRAVQADAMEEIISWVAEYRVDVVLVSGDVYDRAQPRAEVVELLNSTLARIRRAGAYVVLISGNHDSATRLGFGAQIMAHGGVFLRTRVELAARPVLFTRSRGTVRALDTAQTLADTPAPADDSAVAVYGIPYAEPRSVAPRMECAASHQSVLETIAGRISGDLEQRPGTAAVVLAHAFVTGASATDSERVIDAGGLGTVSADVFDPFTYAALGHLHRRQTLREGTRYSGSPVAYSFSETGQTKGAWLLEISGPGQCEVTALEHRAGLHLARLRGHLDDLLRNPAYEHAESAWCQVVVTDPQRPEAAMDRVRTRFPDTVELRWEPDGGRQRAQLSYSARIRKAESPESMCASFFEHVRHRPLSGAEELEIENAVAAAHAAPSADEASG